MALEHGSIIRLKAVRATMVVLVFQLFVMVMSFITYHIAVNYNCAVIFV